VCGGVLLLSRVYPSGTVRAYYWIERNWYERWPRDSGKAAIRSIEPALLKAGILRPVRLQIEPGVSFLLDPRDFVPLTILRTGEWQPEVWESLSPSLSEGRVFMDVGAHIGYFTLKAAVRVGKTGRVVAFEPNPETLALLRGNIEASQAQNVTVEPIACTDREQTLTLFAAPIANTGASSLSRTNADVSIGEPPRPFTVRGRPIDDVLRELNLTRLDAIKIDVEGAEVYVLRGAVDTLKRFHPKVIMEMIPDQLAHMQTSVADVVSIMKAAGYNRSKPLGPLQTDWEWVVLEPRDMASVIPIKDLSTAGQLIDGFHGLEGGWRWTLSRFTVALRTPPGASEKGAVMTLHFTIPEVLLQKLKTKTITLSAKTGAVTLAPETFTEQGDHLYRREVPASALVKESIDVNFSLDNFLGPAGPDELGVIVSAIELAAK
jgi:FkbM family methyltransferase